MLILNKYLEKNLHHLPESLNIEDVYEILCSNTDQNCADYIFHVNNSSLTTYFIDNNKSLLLEETENTSKVKNSIIGYISSRFEELEIARSLLSSKKMLEELANEKESDGETYNFEDLLEAIILDRLKEENLDPCLYKERYKFFKDKYESMINSFGNTSDVKITKKDPISKRNYGNTFDFKYIWGTDATTPLPTNNRKQPIFR